MRNKIINRLVKEGSNADEPTNIRLSDYSRYLALLLRHSIIHYSFCSDEGDTSSTSSNEVGRDDEDFFYPAVPPPSPAPHKKVRPKGLKVKSKALTRSPNAQRKPLPVN